jgi:GAF domain-containing protein
VAAVLECVLDCGLELTGARLGNVQLMDWNAGCLKIASQRGFGPEFLAFFKRVALNDGTACGRALHSRSTIVIPDTMADAGFPPYRDVAARAGFRAVQSTPLVSRSGALVGVLSNHFGEAGRPARSSSACRRSPGWRLTRSSACARTIMSICW